VLFKTHVMRIAYAIIPNIQNRGPPRIVILTNSEAQSKETLNLRRPLSLPHARLNIWHFAF
jgi:hypothetical protein